MSGKNPLGNSREPQSYEGLNVIVPIGGWQLIKATRDPTSSDKKYPIGSIWVNTSSNKAQILTSAPGNWQVLESSAGGVLAVANGGTGAATFTAHGVLVGEGTSPIVATAVGTTGQVLTGSTGADPAFAAIGTNSGLTVHGVLLAENNSAFVATTAGTNGQLLIGGTGDPAFASPTTSTGIAFTNGNNTLAIDVKTGGYAVVNQASGSASLAAQTMYVTNNGGSLVTYTLPATVAQGTYIRIIGQSAGGWKIAQNAGQTIVMNAQTTTSGTGGSLSSVNKNACITLVAIDATTNVWIVADSSGGSLTFV